MKEVHSPTCVDGEGNDPEDDDGDSPIFKLKVSISLDVMGRCVQLNWEKNKIMKQRHEHLGVLSTFLPCSTLSWGFFPFATTAQ